MTRSNQMKFRLHDLIMSLKQREKIEPKGIILKQFTQKYLNRKFIPIIIINHKIRDVTLIPS